MVLEAGRRPTVLGECAGEKWRVRGHSSGRLGARPVGRCQAELSLSWMRGGAKLQSGSSVVEAILHGGEPANGAKTAAAGMRGD